MSTITDQINRAVEVLNQSERGRRVMRYTLEMLQNGGIGLDQNGQLALMALLSAAFMSHPGAVTNAMRDALEAK